MPCCSSEEHVLADLSKAASKTKSVAMCHIARVFGFDQDNTWRVSAEEAVDSAFK